MLIWTASTPITVLLPECDATSAIRWCREGLSNGYWRVSKSSFSLINRVPSAQKTHGYLSRPAEYLEVHNQDKHDWLLITWRPVRTINNKVLECWRIWSGYSGSKAAVTPNSSNPLRRSLWLCLYNVPWTLALLIASTLAQTATTFGLITAPATALLSWLLPHSHSDSVHAKPSPA